MVCYYPLQGYRARYVNDSGRRPVVFNRNDGFSDMPVSVPCGQCIGCRLERSRQWAIRCVHEAQLYQDNCFITLTYSNEYLPVDGSLDITHFQKFMKRLRKRFGKGIRYFHCGEYGAKYRRPHYHAILFNFDFKDKYLWKEENAFKLCRSPVLERLWPFGHSSVGTATFESAAYVARYILKKVNGDAADAHYLGGLDVDSGEVFKLKPEYTTMSRRPGIGKAWFDKYKDDVFPYDEVVLLKRGKMRPPKYYDFLYELVDPKDMARIKACRKSKFKDFAQDYTAFRLDVRKQVKEKQISALFSRKLDGDI